MNKAGPIIVIEDDQDDQDMLVAVFSKLKHPNNVIYFNNGAEALVFLNSRNVHPFLILSDINMPKLNGLELRNKILADLHLQNKYVPFLFFTTVATQRSVMDAYAMSVNGFFIKPASMPALENIMRKIIEYWKECIAPGHYN